MIKRILANRRAATPRVEPAPAKPAPPEWHITSIESEYDIHGRAFRIVAHEKHIAHGGRRFREKIVEIHHLEGLGGWNAHHLVEALRNDHELFNQLPANIFKEVI